MGEMGMKKAVLGLAAMVMLSVTLVGCNPVARSFGGTITVDVPKGQKFVNATWKDKDSIWYITRPMREGETPETFFFQEDTTLGILEGTVIFKESK
ncbi:hypothetical protein SECTIM467_92 [Brevibacillus phage SecTim467]|uniref:Membrane lipoprotein n=2 Tax=Jenstvirus jenst TaxID=1982225 RepID=A0A0K2CPB9_9CAUD|nr:hypothetical protein AVV11_gp104 [Brevibacillus phage Jenst]ALA07216.1 hypothetical protein JENST_87 [Brevibacillus phage Jenst]ALA07578.1 hypothetical protein SECTIM467_92 [Brevibacillus phage SecTim467]